MAYVIRIRQRARDDLYRCGVVFGEQFENEIRSWLEQLADEAEQGGDELSVDAIELLEHATGAGQALMTAKRWWKSSISTKLLALWAVLRDRAPPWHFRMANAVFQVVNPHGQLATNVPIVATAFYEVDRVNRQIVVTTVRLPL